MIFSVSKTDPKKRIFDFFYPRNFRKIAKLIFWGQFLTLKNMVTKFFRNSNFSDFLGIKSEINQLIEAFEPFWPLTPIGSIRTVGRQGDVRGRQGSFEDGVIFRKQSCPMITKGTMTLGLFLLYLQLVASALINIIYKIENILGSCFKY